MKTTLGMMTMTRFGVLRSRREPLLTLAAFHCVCDYKNFNTSVLSPDSEIEINKAFPKFKSLFKGRFSVTALYILTNYQIISIGETIHLMEHYLPVFSPPICIVCHTACSSVFK